MILLCGIPSEDPIALLRERLDEIGAAYLMYNQRSFRSIAIECMVDRGGVTGILALDGRTVRLEQICGVYIRLMDDGFLPELRGQPEDSPSLRYARSLSDILTRWCEIAPGRVVNRIAPMGSNASKPFQSQLIRQYGFAIPETLITTEPSLVYEFLKLHRRVIYKSMSGVRSIVRELRAEDFDRLERIRWCPAQFQAYVEGRNVRVHTIGRQCFATAIISDATDYRYAARQVGEPAGLVPYDLDGDVAERCLALSSGLGLAFAGIDLKLAPDGRVYCFEVNPCPAYSYYEANTDQPISLALARYLAGEQDEPTAS